MQVVDVQQAKLRQAVLTALGLFAFLMVLLFLRWPSVLPDYPAVILAFLLWGVLPGWFLQRAIFATDSTTVIEQIAVAFLMSMGLAAIPGLVGLRLHWNIETFALAYGALAAVSSGLAYLLDSESPDVQPDSKDGEPEDLPAFPSIALRLLILIPLIAIFTSPWWEDGRISRDADDLVNAAYVREYSVAELDASKPFLNRAQGQFGRMQFNVWVVYQGLLTQNSGVRAIDLLEKHMPPIMLLLVVASTFALARGLFRSDQIALLACALLLIYGASDLASHEGFGRNIFLRVSQDKMVASFILLPLSLLIATRYVEFAGRGLYVGLLLAVAALTVTHPMSLMFFSAIVAVLALLRMATDRSQDMLARHALLLAPTAIASLGMLLGSRLGAGRLLTIGEPFRRVYHIADLPGDQIVGSYHLILHPFILGAVLLVPAIWMLSKRSLGTQVLVASVAASLAMMFIPPVATALADIVNEEAVWRAYWLIPAPLIIAYGLHRLVARLPSGGPLMLGIRSSQGMAALLGVFVIGAGSVFVQEHYTLADDGAFYNRTSETLLLPWTGGSILLGGLDRAFSSDWRPTPAEQGLLDFLVEEAGPDSTVLIEPKISTRFFPAVLGPLQIGYNGAPQIQERREVKARFFRIYGSGYDTDLKGAELLAALQRFGVDLVVVASRSAEEEIIQAVGGERLGETERIDLLEADDFRLRLGDPIVIDGAGGGSPLWSFSPTARDMIVGHAEVTMPEGLSDSLVQFGVELIASAAASSDEAARLVVTFEPVGGSDTGPIHTVIDLFIETGTQDGQSLFRVRSPGVTFSSGETYNVWVWRDGEHAIDTFQGDILFSSLDIRWFPAGPPLGVPAYHIYSIDLAAGS